MKCFNLTDVPTPGLVANGLVNMTLAVRSALIQPGEFAEVVDDVLSRREAAHYVSLGALAVDVLPPSYTVRREHLRRAAVKPSATPPRARRRS